MAWHVRKSLGARRALMWGTLIVGAAACAVWSGPLNPPAGPITSTYKTLTEVEPRIAVNAANTPGDADSLFKIVQPGSYSLTGNITGVVGKHGIEIASSGVTLDLNGFDLSGVPAMGAFDGVYVSLFGAHAVVIRNGTVRGWGGDGIDLTTSTFPTSITGIVATDNVGHGISTGASCLVSGCVAGFNGGNGINGYIACQIIDSVSTRNSGSGIAGQGGTTISRCSSFQNTLNGIDTSTSGGCAVLDCNVRANTLDGIKCYSYSLIRGNLCTDNGLGVGDGAGIHATNIKNRIEDNTCSGSDRGIDVDMTGNIIIRNSSSLFIGSNWDVAANNVCGPVIDRTAVMAPAITGNSGASSMGTTDPFANFSH